MKKQKNIALASLPLYATELDSVEQFWDELREKAFGNVVFDSIDAPEDSFEGSLRAMEFDTPRVHSIVVWARMMSALLK
ncbi:MAG: hypothetical protein HGB15_01640 [Chlorobaculum sp.]|nr:hypothetical protein [Chlorobaculum sp.]